MDLKALIAKMDKIESNQLLNEGFPTVADAKARADKEKTTGKFDKKEIKPGVTQYTRKSSTFDDGGKDSDQKKAEKKKKNEDIEFKSSIARGLVEEFGYEVEESTLTENPHASDPAKSAAWAALSPEDQKWLGGADPTDPAILARAPNKGKPAATAPGAGPATAPALVGTQNQTPDAAAQASRIADRMDAEAGANTAGQAKAPAAVDPAVAATREKFKALMDKLEKTGGVSGSAPAPVAPKPTAPAKPTTGAGTKPAQSLPGVTGVPGAQISNTPAAESVTYEDDQTLLAIKNIRF